MDDYSADEIEVHYEACLRLKGKKTKDLAEAVRMATLGNRRLFKQYTKELESIGEKLDQVAGRVKFDVEDFFARLGRIGMQNHG